MKTEMVSVDRIVVPDHAKRAPSKVSDGLLRASIEQGGIQQPLILVRDGTRLLLAKGLRRLREARALGLAKVPAVIDVVPAGTTGEKHAAHLRFILVHHRQDLLPTQRGELVRTLKNRFAMNNKQVAAYLGVAPDSVTNWLAVLHYIEPVRKAMDAGALSMNSARAFDGMTEPGQAALWKRFGEAMMTGTGRELTAWHKQARATFPPANHPHYYRQPGLVASRLARKSGPRKKAKPLTGASPAEKRNLANSLDMKQTELRHNQEELQRYTDGIDAAIAPIAAILRHPNLLALVPEGTREEFERFAEVYI